VKKVIYTTLTVIYRLIVFSLLTLFTQVGGIIYLLSLLPFLFIKIKNKWLLKLGRIVSFIVLYAIGTAWVIPAIAKTNGRVPLPVFSSPHLKPAIKITWLLNRHYVRKELKTLAEETSKTMAGKHEGLVTYYLEAGFPFINGYPLWPHITHDDGKKLDLAFYYHSPGNEELQKHGSPSPVGYGVCEDPRPGEVNQPQMCAQQGFWKYIVMSEIMPQDKKLEYIFDEKKTRELLLQFINNPNIDKIFIEPHLKQRLKLKSPKVRVHGCHTVRHDDHIHITMK